MATPDLRDVRDLRDLVAATPATRNRVVDALRALSITVVVLGHWLTAAVVWRDGRLIPDAVLNIAPWTHPLTWVLQVMPVFFLVGGYANALSWRSATRRHEPYAAWLRARLRRLGTPLVPLLAFWLLAVTAADAAGADRALVRTASQVALVPTWFLAAYVLVVAVTPVTLALWERRRWGAVVALMALAGLADWLSIAHGLVAVGFVNYLVVWCCVAMLGVAWLDGALEGARRRALMALVGLTGLLLLVGPGPYPVAMIGVDGAELNNAYPTRVTLAFLGLAQGGLVLLVEPWLRRRLERPRLWAATIFVNARIMTIYLWHLTAMLLVIGASVLMGGVGLGLAPLSTAWWLTRPLWWAVLLVVLAGLFVTVGWYEKPARETRPAPPTWHPVLATVALCGGLAVMAGQGLVTTGGIRWWWPVVVIAAVASLGRLPGWPGRARSVPDGGAHADAHR